MTTEPKPERETSLPLAIVSWAILLWIVFVVVAWLAGVTHPAAAALRWVAWLLIVPGWFAVVVNTLRAWFERGIGNAPPRRLGVRRNDAAGALGLFVVGAMAASL